MLPKKKNLNRVLSFDFICDCVTASNNVTIDTSLLSFVKQTQFFKRNSAIQGNDGILSTDFGFGFPRLIGITGDSYTPRAGRTIGNNSETRGGKDFSDNGGSESCHRTFSVSSRGAAAVAGALEINFGLMPRRRHRESFDVTTNSRCPRDVIFRISSAGFLEQTIRASLATSQPFSISRIIDPICEVSSDPYASFSVFSFYRDYRDSFHRKIISLSDQFYDRVS